jgi:acetyltransferase-like isoleucine patch superfamily enzyme
MIALTIPTTDVNSESVTVVRWHAEDRSEVTPGQPLVEIETSKAILDVDATERGVLLRACEEGEQVHVSRPLGYVFEGVDALERFAAEQAAAAPVEQDSAGRITAPARKRAAELGVDIDDVARTSDGLVTTKLVEAFAAAGSMNDAGLSLPDPLQAPPGVQRILIFGAGLGATQVLDILDHDDAQHAIAVVDDDRARFGQDVEGIPIVGGAERAVQLFGAGAFDAAVISISTSVPVRTRLRQLCERAGIPLTNAIDPTARIARGVTFGSGNVVCANCHFGVGTVVGDNNFISAYNSFDHHSELGCDISTGPGCMTSGLVTIGDRCRLGTGIFIEPHVTLGAGVQVASGAVIVSAVPAEHAVKTKVVTTAVVPLRAHA